MTKALKSSVTSPHPLTGPNGIAYEDSAKACVLADSLAATFMPPPNIDQDRKRMVAKIAYQTIPPTTSAPPSLISAEDVSKCLKKTKPFKAPGPDGIQNIILRNLPTEAITSMTALFNSSLTIGHFPSSWKRAHVIVFQKPGKDPTLPTNYRPISLLNTIGKVFEALIRTKILAFLGEKNLIPDIQHGFRKAHATTHQLLRLVEAFTIAYNKKETTGAIFLDVEKAFDTVWHAGLLSKLFTLNFPPYLINIIRSFLHGRSFRVKFNEKLSQVKPIRAGVPQGAILSPTLFNIFLADIPEIPNCHMALYADDTAIFTHSLNVNFAINKLQKGLDFYANWADLWGIKINPLKSCAILLTTKRIPMNKTLTLNGADIPWSRTVKYLGVTIDYHLTWTPHINQIRKKAIAALSVIRPICRHAQQAEIPLETLRLLYSAYVRSILEYAAPAWAHATPQSFKIKILQRVQNKALRLITHSDRDTHTDELHERAKVVFLADRYKLLCENFYKNLNKATNPTIQGLGHYEIIESERRKLPKTVLASTAPTNQPRRRV